jgi:hypothetical protein
MAWLLRESGVNQKDKADKEKRAPPLKPPI